MHVDILQKFLDLLVAYAKKLQVGDPFNPNTKVGPLCNKVHFDKVKSYIDLAVKSGAKILCGESVE